jgi:hypothetical protein
VKSARVAAGEAAGMFVFQILRFAQDDIPGSAGPFVILSAAKDLDHPRFGLASGADA